VAGYLSQLIGTDSLAAAARQQRLQAEDMRSRSFETRFLKLQLNCWSRTPM